MSTKKTVTALAMHFGADGPEIVNTQARYEELYGAHTTVDEWGALGPSSEDQTLEGERKRFAPGRDIKWAGVERLYSQAERLATAGITLDSVRPGAGKPFSGDAGVKDLIKLASICDGGEKSKGLSASWLFDATPDLFVAEELVRLTGEIVTEKHVEITARQHFALRNYNTYMDTYRYDRVSDLGRGFARPAHWESASERATSQANVNRDPVYLPLREFEDSCGWGFFELEKWAEIRGRHGGALDIDLVRERLRITRENNLRTENMIAYFGWSDLGLTGVLTDPLMPSSPAPQQLGAVGSNSEDDRDLFVNTVKGIIDDTTRVYAPDRILIGTKAWTYIHTKIYKDLSSSDTRTLASVIMEALAPLGIKDILWAPEMEFRQEQADSIANEHGMADLANIWAGGLNQQNCMLVYNSSAEAGSMVVGKDLQMRPQHTREDRTTVRMIMSAGSYDLRQPKAYSLLTDIGPA